MQFHHPHAFRPQVLEAEVPEVPAALLAAGAERVLLPGPAPVVAGLRCRRMVFERTCGRPRLRSVG